PDSEEEELPDAEKGEKDDGKGHDNESSDSNKSPKGTPGSDLGGDSEDVSNGKNTKANSGKNSGKNKGGKGKGKEHFHHGMLQYENVEKFRRDIPDFAISYVIPSTRSSEIPGDGDYNELSVVSEEFLDRSFKSVFEDMAVGHFGTAAYAMVNTGTPFTVDFRVTLEFGVPGEVPTVQFLFFFLAEAVERNVSSQQYLFDLNAMSTTNPFSAATSFTLIAKTNSDQGTVAGGLTGGPGSNRPPMVSNDKDKKLSAMHMIIIILSVVMFLTLCLLGYLWYTGRNSGRKFAPYNPEQDNNMDLPIFKGKLGIASRSENGDTESEHSDPYGADDETVAYLKALRQRYRDEVSVSSDDQTVPRGYKDIIDDDDDDDDSRIRDEQNGIVFLSVGGNESEEEHDIESHEEEQADEIDLLKLELNAIESEDDLGSF
ncbi:MAG: hypothetical protein SGILL_007416, partial [Bacillariaceae sp.]